MKGQRVSGPPPVVASVITHLPNEEGYHARRFEIVTASLTMLRAGAPNVPVFVWDNGSCEHLRDWLEHEYRPEYLMFSANVGKTNARTGIFGAFPRNTIIATADDDFGYCPGWLDTQIDLLKGFPNVGCVTGYVCRTAFRWGIKSTLKWAEENAQLERGRFLPDEYERQFCVSIGRDYEGYHVPYTAGDMDYRVTYGKRQAYCTAHHAQFVAFQGRMWPFMVWNREAVAGEMNFDTEIDRAGLLRLGTIERTTWHMGNVPDKEVECTDTREKENSSPVFQPAI